MEDNELKHCGDPYGALSFWFFDANRDPERFLRMFEGIAPDVEGMVWTAEGYVCVDPGAHAANPDSVRPVNEQSIE